MNILPLLDRPIAFQRSFIRLEMGVTAALFLSQLTYWTNRTTDDGWVYKTQDEWEEETGLSRYEQEGARKKLRGLGVLLERKQGLPARLYYKIDNDVLCQLLTSAYKDAEKPHIGEGKTTRPVRGKPTNILTENTTEIITDGESADADTQQPADQRINYQVILDTYHEILPEMPPVKILTDGRKKHLRTFWKKFNFNESRWRAYLEFIGGNCRWMLEDRPNGRGGFWRRKNLDYLITERCYVSVKEERANDK
ncbi:TPA: replication protein [Escherichia coli]|nr:replication protein [Escherichia coli]